MENVNDLQVRAFYERLRALSDGGVVVNGLMVLSQSRFEDLLETYRTYFFDAVSDFDDESYHEPLSYDGSFDSLKEKLDDVEDNLNFFKSLASNEAKDEPVEKVESDSETELDEDETETVESEVDPVVANAFGVKKDADDELEKEDSKDDVNSYSDSVDEKISDSLAAGMKFELKIQSESQLAETYGKDAVNSVKSENDSFSAEKSFNKGYDLADEQTESDSDQDVKSSAEVLASEVVNSESFLESLDDLDIDNVDVGDTFASSDIHVTSDNTESDDDGELDVEAAAGLDALMNDLGSAIEKQDSDED